MDPAERSFAATVPFNEMETTLTPRPASRPPDATGSMARYTISNRFDSSATLMRMRQPDGATSTRHRLEEATFSGTTRRLRRSPERMMLALAIVVALVAAVAIALL
jgi:hypothetical protein